MTEPCGYSPALVSGWTRYPEYKESGVEWLGEIPAGWGVVELKRVAPARSGRTVAGRPDESVWHLDLEQIATDTGRVRVKHRVPISEIASSTVWFDQSNVLYSKLRPYLNKVVTPDEPGIATSELIPLSPKPDLVTRSFLAYYLRSPRFVAYASRHVSGTKMPRVIPRFFWGHLVPLPPLPEQHSIVRFLAHETAKVDALIAKQHELITLLQEKRTALISHAVTKGLDPDAAMKDSGIEWLGKIPAHWEVVQLRRVAFDRCDGPFGSGLKSTHYAEDGVRVVRLQNIGHGEFEGADAAFIPQEHYLKLGEHSVLPGDLLIAGLGDTNHPAGRACVAPADLGLAMVKADCFRFRLDQSRAQPQFLALQLSATASIASGLMSTGATRQRTSLASTAARAIAIPDLQEQSRIVDYVTRKTIWLDHAQHAVQRATDHLNEYRTALISVAVTGKIDVRRALETVTAPNPVSPHPTP